MNEPLFERPPQLDRPQAQGLADVLDRVLDKGVVIAGDISINILDIELLTIKVRLLIASVDKAQEMGINWWQHDTHLTTKTETSVHAKSGEGRAKVEASTDESLEAKPAKVREEYWEEKWEEPVSRGDGNDIPGAKYKAVPETKTGTRGAQKKPESKRKATPKPKPASRQKAPSQKTSSKKTARTSARKSSGSRSRSTTGRSGTAGKKRTAGKK